MSEKNKPPFNPLDKINLGNSVANAILKSEMHSLPPAEFKGIGIYALYYFGNNPLYSYITKYNRENEIGWPIYVGKAIAKGGRKGVLGNVNTGKNIYNRLKKHAKTIEETQDLNIGDFKCQFMTVDSIWIPLGEQLLIDEFKPFWNVYIDGFGNNDPGSGRYNQQNSPWDILHPGRGWAAKLAPNKRYSDIESLRMGILEMQRKEYERLINRPK
jgi:hypothetical protein